MMKQENQENQKNQDPQKWLQLLAGEAVADVELSWETKILRRELSYRRYPPILELQILEKALANSNSKQSHSTTATEATMATVSALPWWQRGLLAFFNHDQHKNKPQK